MAGEHKRVHPLENNLLIFFGPVVSLSEILRKSKNTDDDSVHKYLCNVIYHSKTSNVSKYKSS